MIEKYPHLLTGNKDSIDGVRQRGLGRIHWLAILLPTLFVGLFEFLRHQLLGHILPGWLGTGWPGNVAGALVVGAVVFAFVRVFAGILNESALRLARSREEAGVILERQRIAREMHDGVAQALFYLGVKLREVDGLIAAGEDERARGELRTSERHLKDTHRRARAVIADLRQQAELEDFGEAVRRTANELAERLGLRVICEVEEGVSLPASSRQHLLAIIKEALTNAHRHGCTERIAVRVRKTGRAVKVEVSDSGVGFDPGSVPREGRYGRAIMEERARIVGGRLRLDSAPGRGTCVTVSVPEGRS